MKRFISFFALMTFFTASMMSAQMQRCELKVGDFTNLHVIDGVNVEYRCNPDSSGIAVFTASKDVIDGLMFKNNTKGKLSIQIATELVGKAALPTITVYSSYLSDVENSSDSTLRLLKLVSTPRFSLKTSGNGKIIVHGLKAQTVDLSLITGHSTVIVDGTKCENLTIRNLGTGEIQADKLPATNVKCIIMGTGTIGCDIRGGTFQVRGSGTGKIYYKGNPDKTKKLTLGPVKLIPLDTK
jgi:hypothetical protein